MAWKVIDPITGAVKAIIEPIEENDLVAGCGGVLIVGLVLLGCLLAGVDYLDRKTDDLINRVYPAYETGAEKSQRSEVEKNRIYASLRKWTDRWVRENRSRLEDTSRYGAQPTKNLVRLYTRNKDIFVRDIWAIVTIPCYEKNLKNEPLAFKSQEFILRSQDHGQSWELKWKRHHSLPATIILKGIKVIDEQRACAMLYVTGDPSEFYKFYFAMLYTLDGGKSWQIEDKWDPGKVKRLRL